MLMESSQQTRGFTLIELLVVVGIILVLAGIGLTVGRTVVESGKKTATADTIRLLGNAAADYSEETGSNVPRVVDLSREFAAPPTSTEFWPLADAADMAGDFVDEEAILPSTALWLVELKRNSPGSYDLVSAVDPKLSTTVTVESADSGNDAALPTILDPFGNPIRFVHPAYDGGYGTFVDGGDKRTDTNRTIDGVDTDDGNVELRRSFRPLSGDGADEGICRNDRAYFYSAGIDGDPGTVFDNVYSADSQPSFPYETSADQIEQNPEVRRLPLE